jgi:hypothetical protein
MLNKISIQAPPVVIAVISILYFLAAASTITIVEEIGYIGAAIEFAICVALGIGLWSLRTWARIAEIVMCYLQLAGVTILIVLVLVVPDIGQIREYSELAFVFVLLAVAALNILILLYLMNPNVKERFH